MFLSSILFPKALVLGVVFDIEYLEDLLLKVTLTLDITEKYSELVDSGQLEYDQMQSLLVQKLSEFQKNVLDYESTWKMIRNKDLLLSKTEQLFLEVPVREVSPPVSTSILKSFFIGSYQEDSLQTKADQTLLSNQLLKEQITDDVMSFKPPGLYIWGGSGCGKTFLLDLTYDLMNTDFKQRLHFNEFMLRVHRSNFTNSKVFYFYF